MRLLGSVRKKGILRTVINIAYRCVVKGNLVHSGDMFETDDRRFVLEEEMEASVQHDLALLREHFAELGELSSNADYS